MKSGPSPQASPTGWSQDQASVVLEEIRFFVYSCTCLEFLKNLGLFITGSFCFQVLASTLLRRSRCVHLLSMMLTNIQKSENKKSLAAKPDLVRLCLPRSRCRTMYVFAGRVMAPSPFQWFFLQWKVYTLYCLCKPQKFLNFWTYLTHLILCFCTWMFLNCDVWLWAMAASFKLPFSATFD